MSATGIVRGIDHAIAGKLNGSAAAVAAAQRFDQVAGDIEAANSLLRPLLNPKSVDPLARGLLAQGIAWRAGTDAWLAAEHAKDLGAELVAAFGGAVGHHPAEGVTHILKTAESTLKQGNAADGLSLLQNARIQLDRLADSLPEQLSESPR